MDKKALPAFHIRPATTEDIPVMFAFVRELGDTR